MLLQLLGSEQYLATVLAIILMAIRLLKSAATRAEWALPKWSLPLVSVLIAFILVGGDQAIAGAPIAGAAWAGLLGTFLGVGASGAHELAKAVLDPWLGEELRALILGRLKATAKTKAKAGGAKTITGSLFLIAALVLPGCATLLPYLVKIAQVAQQVASLVDVVEAGADEWFEAHPDEEAEAKVDNAVHRARAALAVFNGAAASAQASHAGNVGKAQEELLAAWENLRQALMGTGILGDAGLMPAGGGSFGGGGGQIVLPTTDELAASLGAP